MSYFDDEKDDKDPEDEEVEGAEEGEADQADSDADADADESDADDVDVDLDEDGEEDEEGDVDADEGDASDEDADADEGDDDSDENLSAIAQKKKWRERALAAEAKLKGKKPALKPSDKPPTKKTASADNSALTNFRFDHPSLKTKEVEEIKAYAKLKGITLEKAYKSDVIRIMIQRNQRKIQQQGGSTTPSRRTQPTKPTKDWSRAGREDMEAEAARRRIASRQGR